MSGSVTRLYAQRAKLSEQTLSFCSSVRDDQRTSAWYLSKGKLFFRRDYDRGSRVRRIKTFNLSVV